MKNFKDIYEAVTKELDKLNAVEDYLNEAGKVRRNTFKMILRFFDFAYSVKDLAEWEDWQDLSSRAGQNPEYYKVLRQVNRLIEKMMKEEM